MVAILEIPEVRERLSRLSVDEYHRLGEFNENGRRTELIRGLIIEKMSKTPLHRLIASLLYEQLRAQAPKGFSVWKEEPLTLSDSEPEPDVSVIRGEMRDFGTAHPTTAELVVEVAVSSPALDRENAHLYAEAGVGEYWIVLARERQVEIYRRPEGGVYKERQLVARDGILQCPAMPSIRIPVNDLFT